MGALGEEVRGDLVVLLHAADAKGVTVSEVVGCAGVACGTAARGACEMRARAACEEARRGAARRRPWLAASFQSSSAFFWFFPVAAPRDQGLAEAVAGSEECQFWRRVRRRPGQRSTQ